jgi:cytochrome c5
MSVRNNSMSGKPALSRHRIMAASLVLAISGAALVPAAAEELDGGQLYNQYCAICHKAGLNAAPKYGSKPLWAKRIAQGRDTMYANAINGLRGMPPRGGFADLTDEEVKAATDYMVRAAGGWGD